MQLSNVLSKPQISLLTWTKLKWWQYFLAILVALVAKLPTLTNSTVFIDEPIYLAQAMRLNSLEAFVYAFQYRIDTKFQLGLLPYIIGTLISVPNALIIVHLFGLLATFSSACLLIALSKRIFKDTIPGFLALFLWCLFLNTDELAAATLLECFQAPLLLIAFWVFLPVIQNSVKPYRSLFWCGICLGLATLIKPPGLLIVPIFILAFLLPPNSYSRFLSKKFWISSLVLSAGFMSPLILFVAPYFFNSEALAALNLCLFQITREYATNYDPTQSNFRRALGLLTLFGPFYLTLIFTSLIFFLQRLLKSPGKWNEIDRSLLILLLCGWILFVGYSLGQSKTHYLLPVLPFLLLVFCYQIVKIFKKQNFKKQIISYIYFIIISFIVLFGNVSYYFRLIGDNGAVYAHTQNNINVNKLAEYIDANTKPNDSIFVYYNAPEIYWKANRHPATTEPTGTYLANFYSQFWFDRNSAELLQDKAAMIIGIDNPRVPSFIAANLTELPVIGNMLKLKYDCSRDEFPNTIICKLKTKN